ncbi:MULTISPECIES: DUF262 domain-containing protein [Shewanella]|uniref:DUF262 domain-containing protein n=1 Tax=Shewanella TaxID=22 RepID=UPI001183C0E0|nr:DUF262 domain-containing protein [Shewanella algae]MBO2638667.1 DUF262 domain-containing protein [Shewanella algae]MBO2647032.1 DUF262 domain-containing protein [Shewanella algae]TVL04677.1 hypothetical protein AYI84_05950 [Shewanella algae]TVL55143.1 hypothetical protein AYI99_03650 [Shewanella algae]
MKIEASDKEIQEVLSSGYFEIPRFQRPYSWGREEVENFWNDIIGDKTNSYFIGSMVVYQTKKPYFGIVDGQQRLTTITIILSVIRDAFIILGEINFAKGIHKYIETPNNDFENEFVLNAETSFPYLQNHIQTFKDNVGDIHIECDVGVEESNLKYAYELIYKKLEEQTPLNQAGQLEIFESDTPIAKLKQLRDKFLSLKLVFIQLDNEEDAYLIFETLNARGQDLKTSDLVKNLLLKTIKSTNHILDSPKEAWNSIIKKFDDISESNMMESFLLHFWISTKEYSTDKRLFSNIKKYIRDDSSNARKLLNDLTTYSKLYCKMINPDSFNWSKESTSVKTSLKYLNVFKVKQQSSFVLALLNSYENKLLTLKQLKSILEKIEYFHFVFNAITQQRSSGGIASIYSQHSILLTKASNNDDVQRILSSFYEKLREKLPSYDEFSVKFMELNYLSNKTRNKTIIKYALCKILGDNHGGLDIDHDNLTIEHLTPESKIKYGASQDSVGCIGNLILTDQNTNGSILSDKAPEIKISHLKSSGYPVTQNFLDVSIWDEHKIQERAGKIANRLYYKVKI